MPLRLPCQVSGRYRVPESRTTQEPDSFGHANAAKTVRLRAGGSVRTAAMQSPAPSHRRPALLETPLDVLIDVLSADLTIPQTLWETELDDHSALWDSEMDVDDYASYEVIYAAPPSPDPNVTAFTRPYELLEVAMDVDVDFTLELEMFDLLELS